MNPKSTAWTPLGRALRDYRAGNLEAALVVRTDFGEAEELAISLFFRERHELSPLEREAIRRCHGRTLDAGAGAGAIALLLQDQGIRVTALDVLPEAVEVMRERGLLDVQQGNLFDLPPDLRGEVFDTVLLLMNGTGIAGTLSGLDTLLCAVRNLLGKGGQLLIDSTDLRYDGTELGEAPGEEDEGPGEPTGGGPPAEAYIGELHYQLEYGGERGDPFPYLFVDPDTFREHAEAGGWHFELLSHDDRGNFLARLSFE